MGSCHWWPGASPSTPKSPKALLSGCGYLPHISNSLLSKALSCIQLKSDCSIFMRLNYMKWLIFDHFLPTKWFDLIQLEAFFWAGGREKHHSEYELRTGDGATSWRRGLGPEARGGRGFPTPFPGVGTAAGAPMPWLHPGEKMLVGVGRTNAEEHQLHWWVMKSYKVKAACCGWKMQTTVSSSELENIAHMHV